MSRYRGVYESWKADPEAFWANAADAVHWAKPYDKSVRRDCRTIWPRVSWGPLQ
ncbi:MAG: acetyl-coenzyme A synthetase N-terminal domain-containing protein, partial [Methyloceanibacter sp.]